MPRPSFSSVHRELVRLRAGLSVFWESLRREREEKALQRGDGAAALRARGEANPFSVAEGEEQSR